MHGKGVIHCDVKLDNTLVCRGNGPGGFVGKLADPGLWCGESGLERILDRSQRFETHEKIPATYFSAYNTRTHCTHVLGTDNYYST